MGLKAKKKNKFKNLFKRTLNKLKKSFSSMMGTKPGDIITIGAGGGKIIPVGGFPLPLGGAFSFDRLITEDGKADWFFTLGAGFSTPGYSFAIDRGKSEAQTKDGYKGASTSLNIDLAPVGIESCAPGWNPKGFADKINVKKGGLHLGEGINYLWNMTIDLGE